MPQITDQDELLARFHLERVSMGPTGRGWEGEYLKCPKCGNFVLKGKGYDECSCGNISVDSDMLRITVRHSAEEDVETYRAIAK